LQNTRKFPRYYPFIIQVRFSYSLILHELNYNEEHNWQFWKFSEMPDSFWYEIENVRNAMKWIATQYGVNQLDDWYKITREMVENVGGNQMLRIHGGLTNILLKCYPSTHMNIQCTI
jgi:hypothetical protein